MQKLSTQSWGNKHAYHNHDYQNQQFRDNNRVQRDKIVQK